MQIYGVTVNTAGERIIHSGAYLAERVHAFTLGTTEETLGRTQRRITHDERREYQAAD
jgi:hypothetical protein